MLMHKHTHIFNNLNETKKIFSWLAETIYLLTCMYIFTAPDKFYVSNIYLTIFYVQYIPSVEKV